MSHTVKVKVHNTGDSQVVTQQGTNPARHCLTLVIRRELVFSVWYGHRHYRIVRKLGGER